MEPIEIYVHRLKGMRPTMEDADVISVNKDFLLAGIFDGHGGDQISKKLKEILPKILFSKLMIYVNDFNNYEQIKNAIKKIFMEIDYKYFINYDSVGSTAILILLVKRTDLYLINLGDSRGVVFNKFGKILLETKDHKPENIIERTRIEKIGGKVLRMFNGPYRVDGILSVSRAFGDMYFKKDVNNENNTYMEFKSKVSPEPDIYHLRLTSSNYKNKYYVLLACDGLWDVFNNQEAINYAFKFPGPNPATRGLVMNAVYKKRSSDNVSAMILSIPV
jgi:serine/threonine protein phosphatase PrpC